MRSIGRRLRQRSRIAALSLLGVLAACATQPLVPYSTDTPPLVLLPADNAGLQDKRTRFREIYCAVLDARKGEVPDYRPCDEALTRVGVEPTVTASAVSLAPSRRGLVAVLVPGFGAECLEPWLEQPGTVGKHLRTQGYDYLPIKVEGLSSCERNARLIRDAVMAMPAEPGPPRLVLIGYSKGAPDILEAIVTYPEIRSRIAAVVTAAGAVGGSPLANDAEQYQANLLRYFPGSQCGPGDGGAVDSMRPTTRKKWLATHSLPREIRYYSLVAYPQPERISSVLQLTYSKLSSVDGRNDSQVIFYDQLVPGGTLLGYLNADHWAIAVPIGRTRSTIATMFVTQNAYPREALAEAIMRFVEEDLQAPQPKAGQGS